MVAILNVVGQASNDRHAAKRSLALDQEAVVPGFLLLVFGATGNIGGPLGAPIARWRAPGRVAIARLARYAEGGR